VEDASEILNIKGEVVPVTGKDTRLKMVLRNGKILSGQNEINHNFQIEKIGISKNYLYPRATANPKAIKKIKEADAIIIGPGNHFCSIIPNLLVKGIPEAIRNSKALLIYNCNLVNKKGHTQEYTLDDYVDSINRHIGEDRIDYVIFNSKKPGANLINKYERRKDSIVFFDKNARKKRKYKIIEADLLSQDKIIHDKSDAISKMRSFIRHDSDKLARVIDEITKKQKSRWMSKK
jgi:uncharacterized cofD-like protein